MPLKIGNVKQSKFARIVASQANTSACFTLPAQVQITNVRAFGTDFGAGTITFYARPISSATPVAFATIDGATLTTVQNGVVSGAIPFNRTSEPVVISVGGVGATGGPATIEVEFS